MNIGRYHRQMLVPGIGDAGQQRLHDARVVVIGCGAAGMRLLGAPGAGRHRHDQSG